MRGRSEFEKPRMRAETEGQILFEEFLGLKSDLWGATGTFLLDFADAAGFSSASAAAGSSVAVIVHSDVAASVVDSGAVFQPGIVAPGCPAVAAAVPLGTVGSSLAVVALSASDAAVPRFSSIGSRQSLLVISSLSPKIHFHLLEGVLNLRFSFC
ncbi:hypothetical protein ACOSQ2_005106 [Xanthoceras sorbifolium]